MQIPQHFGTEISYICMEQKVILITGVSSGFGRAMAGTLAGKGHKVYGTVRRQTEPIPNVKYLFSDLLDEDSIDTAFNSLMTAEGHIDVFINNAGTGIGGPLEFCSPEQVGRQMDVNFGGMVRWMARVVPVMRRQGYGRILCISSIGGLIGLPYQGAYSASKFAIEGYCQALRLELRDKGVKVIVIEPGDFSTSFTSSRSSVSSPEAAAAYPSYEASLKSIEKDERNGLKPEYLAGRIAKIIELRHPADNYVIASFLQRLSVFAKWLLPSKIFARLLSAYYGI